MPDYNTANDPELSPALNESQRSDLYAELATGAESGMPHISMIASICTPNRLTSRMGLQHAMDSQQGRKIGQPQHSQHDSN